MTLEELLVSAQGLYEGSNLPVIVTDNTLTMQWANGEALNRFPLLGINNEIRNFFSHYDSDKLLASLKKGKVFTLKYDNPLNIFRVTVVPYNSPDLVGCILSFFQEADESSLNRADMQEMVLSSFTNAYKMPLTIIFSTLGLLSRELSKESGTKPYIKLMSQNCYRLLRLSNNIGDLVRFSTGRGSLNFRNGDLSEFLRGLCEAACILASAIEIPIKYEIPDHPVITRFDPEKLASVVLNLVSNSCKFTREGNEIRIRMEVSGDRVLVTVSDKGTGIQDDILGHIFEPYFSYDPQGNTIKQGGGVGLTLVRNIVSLHGGTVAVQSHEGEGTRVAFTLPIKTDSSVPDYASESSVDYLSDRFSPLYVELSDICGAPMP